MLRDHCLQKIWLSQEAYIEKIANQYKIDLTGHLFNTPMVATKLLPITMIADKPSMILYQRKMGLLLYAAVTM